jgi:Fic family protein
MTLKLKDRLINSFIAIITGVCVVLFGNFSKYRHEDNSKLDDRLTKVELEKVDKDEFEKYKDEDNSKLDDRLTKVELEKVDKDEFEKYKDEVEDSQKESESRIINFMDKRFNDTQKMIEMIPKK